MTTQPVGHPTYCSVDRGNSVCELHSDRKILRSVENRAPGFLSKTLEFQLTQWLKYRPDGTVILSLECRQLFIYGKP